MSLKTFLLWFSGAGALSFLAWLIVLWFIDPELTGLLGIILFYATLGCWVFASLVLVGLLIRTLLHRSSQQIVAFHFMAPTFRQSAWCTLIIIISLILASHNIFSWITGGLLILFFTLLEGFLFSLQKQTPHEPATTTQPVQ